MFPIKLTGTPFTIQLPAAADMVGSTFRFVVSQQGSSGGIATIATDADSVIGFVVNVGAADTAAHAHEVTALSGTSIHIASTAAVGDMVEVTGVSATLLSVKAFSSLASIISS